MQSGGRGCGRARVSVIFGVVVWRCVLCHQPPTQPTLIASGVAQATPGCACSGERVNQAGVVVIERSKLKCRRAWQAGTKHLRSTFRDMSSSAEGGRHPEWLPSIKISVSSGPITVVLPAPMICCTLESPAACINGRADHIHLARSQEKIEAVLEDQEARVQRARHTTRRCAFSVVPRRGAYPRPRARPG